MTSTLPRGSIELAVIAFPGNKFNGEIVPALSELVDGGIVEIIDLVVISKTEDGDLISLEITEMDDGDMFDDLEGEVMGLLGEEDIEAAGEVLDPGTTAAVIVWENIWARRLVSAIADAGGILVAHDRIDGGTVAALIEAFEEE